MKNLQSFEEFINEAVQNEDIYKKYLLKKYKNFNIYKFVANQDNTQEALDHNMQMYVDYKQISNGAKFWFTKKEYKFDYSYVIGTKKRPMYLAVNSSNPKEVYSISHAGGTFVDYNDNDYVNKYIPTVDYSSLVEIMEICGKDDDSSTYCPLLVYFCGNKLKKAYKADKVYGDFNYLFQKWQDVYHRVPVEIIKKVKDVPEKAITYFASYYK